MGIKTQPEFETMETEPIAADAEASTAIAKASATSMAAPKELPSNWKSFQDKELTFPIEAVSMWFGPAPSIIHASGVAKHSEKGSLGTKFVFRIDSYNMRFLAVPGSSDKEARDKIRNSYDKETIIDDGSSLEDYVESLKAQGYAKANIAPYVDLWGRVLWSEKTGPTDPLDDSWDCIRVQCSKTSAENFAYFCGKRGASERLGLLPKLDSVEIIATAREGKSGDYTNFIFTAPTSFAPKAK